MRQKILKQVGVLLTVSILLTFLVVSLTMYSKFDGYMHDSVREEAEYIRVAIEETEGDYLNEKISSLRLFTTLSCWRTEKFSVYQEASILFLGICSPGLHWWLFWCWQSLE